MARLALKQLTIQRGEKILCRELELSLQGGQCWGILGANGAGKTTLLHSLAGLYPLSSGAVLLDGLEIERHSRRLLAQKLGLLFQAQASSFPATVLESVLQGRHPHIPAWKWESAEDQNKSLHALRLLELDALQHRATTTLSGGEQQRLAIATLLNQDAQICLLDEPTNHLDLHQQIRVLELFKTRVKEQDSLVIMALHDINLAQRYCDHVVLMLEGGECLTGRASEVLNVENLTRLYGHPMLVVEGPHGPLFVPQ